MRAVSDLLPRFQRAVSGPSGLSGVTSASVPEFMSAMVYSRPSGAMLMRQSPLVTVGPSIRIVQWATSAPTGESSRSHCSLAATGVAIRRPARRRASFNLSLLLQMFVNDDQVDESVVGKALGHFRTCCPEHHNNVLG